MRIDPKFVRYVPPLLQVRTDRGALRFVGRQSNVQLTETALVCEGALLKVGLLGLEVYFRGAMSEWSAVTIPFSRIDEARQVNWPTPRIIAALCVVLCIPTLYGPFIALYLVWRLRGHYRVQYRDKAGVERAVRFRIRDKKIRAEFDRKLQVYRRAAAQVLGEGGAAWERAN